MARNFKRVGLAAMRLQPLHRGHCLTINSMIQNCETVIIGLGSTNKAIDEHDPFTPDVRMQMIRNVYGDRVKILPLNDIHAAGPEEWVSYIFDKVKKLGMPDPTDYFTGSKADAVWYVKHFSMNQNELTNDNINNYYVPGTEIVRRLHIIDRDKNDVPSATELRTFIKLGTADWEEWVPEVNHNLIIDNFPKEFKIVK